MEQRRTVVSGFTSGSTAAQDETYTTIQHPVTSSYSHWKGVSAMMEKAALLMFFCLFMTLSGSPLYPSFRFGQRDTSILMTSSDEQMEEDIGSPHSERAELRLGRHADAIFTNGYRKVLGQVSARKFLQTIMGKRLGEEEESYMKRQADIYEGTYKEDLTSIQRNHRYRDLLRPRLLS